MGERGWTLVELATRENAALKLWDLDTSILNVGAGDID